MPSHLVNSPPAMRSVRERHLNNSLGRFATGVAVVTSDLPLGRSGLLINSFTSISHEPPLLLIAVHKSSSWNGQLAERAFVVNVLSAEQVWVAQCFSGVSAREPEWVEGEYAPRLAGALAHFECTPWAEYDGGDHTMHVGRVEDFDYRRGDALGYVDSRYVVMPEYFLGVADLE